MSSQGDEESDNGVERRQVPKVKLLVCTMELAGTFQSPLVKPCPVAPKICCPRHSSVRPGCVGSASALLL